MPAITVIHFLAIFIITLLMHVTVASAANKQATNSEDFNGYPEERRVEILSAYFKPRPGTQIEITWQQVSGNYRSPPNQLQGFIEVSPPKNTCLIITRSDSQPDERICKPTLLTFLAGDIDEMGNINFSVKVNEALMETALHWPTPHRWITYVPTKPKMKANELPLEKMLLHHCETNSSAEGRKVDLYLMNKKRWIFTLPKQELALQTDPIPNLYIDSRDQKLGKQFYEVDLNSGKVIMVEKEVTVPWLSTPRNAYLAKPGQLIAENASPPGTRGACRYKYTLKDPPQEGLVECHETADFNNILIPLPCLRKQ